MSDHDMLAWVCRNYKVPATIGGRVAYTGDPKGRQLGTIKSAFGGKLMILLDGRKYSLPFHPAWELEYLQDSIDG